MIMFEKIEFKLIMKNRLHDLGLMLSLISRGNLYQISMNHLIIILG
jgi:hypothetical protein